MKIILAISCILLASAVSAQDPDPGCEGCKKGVSIFFGHLREYHWVYAEMAHIILDVCWDWDENHHLRCEHWMREHWPGMNHVIYADWTVPYVCNYISDGKCPIYFNEVTTKR